MPLTALDHLNIVTENLEATRAFYRDVLGFDDGPRPAFARAGAWMYLNGHPVLHIGTGRKPRTRKSDGFDHVAYAAVGLAEMRAVLRQRGIQSLEVAVPDRELLQVFLSDPDGNEVELVYSGEEARQAIRDGALVDGTVHRAGGLGAPR